LGIQGVFPTKGKLYYVIDGFTVFGFEMCILLPNYGKLYYV